MENLKQMENLELMEVILGLWLQGFSTWKAQNKAGLEEVCTPFHLDGKSYKQLSKEFWEVHRLLNIARPGKKPQLGEQKMAQTERSSSFSRIFLFKLIVLPLAPFLQAQEEINLWLFVRLLSITIMKAAVLRATSEGLEMLQIFQQSCTKYQNDESVTARPSNSIKVLHQRTTAVNVSNQAPFFLNLRHSQRKRTFLSAGKIIAERAPNSRKLICSNQGLHCITFLLPCAQWPDPHVEQLGSTPESQQTTAELRQPRARLCLLKANSFTS
ncbi:hypothetical protein AV530_012128 [Patagioenas fasciata monilis]|uniref:Uncharacterized protein n=1 Tax=Patagioenas fasciata monilis TaxID=372326 RepID=A0A1V4JWJ5_PATFA|nr:hypothetical protein AV530_012128 [Patagioenas fasciata monilis]